ncbi:MAG TPA: hypothetical protein VND65_10285 [Candidatus Binatia bacterium]|nr:hypothetical protein [Candidatus Binatia bacterium]
MTGDQKSRSSRPAARYRQVEISSLKTGRNGKHHALIEKIMQEFVALPEGAALEIPLAEVGGVSLANLRSAVHRAAAVKDQRIETLADKGNFYVWRQKG